MANSHLRGTTTASILTCGLLLSGSLAPRSAHAAFSPFGDGALGASASILGTSSQSSYTTSPLPPSAGANASVGFTLQDPAKSVGSAGVGAGAGFGWLSGSSGASASWDPLIDGTRGGGAWQAGTGYTGSPGGLRMTYFGDLLTINAPGHAGQSGIAHASLVLTTTSGTSLPNVAIGSAASEQAGVGFSGDIVTGQADSWGEGGLSPATSHLQWSGGVQVSSSGQSLTEMQILDRGHVIYSGALQPSYVLQLDIPIVFGQAFSLSAQLQTGASAQVAAPTLSPDDPAYAFTRYAFAQGGATLGWGGIASVDVTSLSGLATVSRMPTASLASTTSIDFSVVSESGTDYRNSISAIPEPPSGPLLLAGWGWLAWRRRFRPGLRRHDDDFAPAATGRFVCHARDTRPDR